MSRVETIGEQRLVSICQSVGAHSGRRPDGSAVGPVMPLESLRELDDADIRALYRHLRQLAPERVASN